MEDYLKYADETLALAEPYYYDYADRVGADERVRLATLYTLMDIAQSQRYIAAKMRLPLELLGRQASSEDPFTCVHGVNFYSPCGACERTVTE